jgi:hypothetical protein
VHSQGKDPEKPALSVTKLQLYRASLLILKYSNSRHVSQTILNQSVYPSIHPSISIIQSDGIPGSVLLATWIPSPIIVDSDGAGGKVFGRIRGVDVEVCEG